MLGNQRRKMSSSEELSHKNLKDTKRGEELQTRKEIISACCCSQLSLLLFRLWCWC